eukprot:6953676-Alexandrium_andersonii.AAC.1
MLVRAYVNALRQFAEAVAEDEGSTLRLPPLATGVNAGVLTHCMPELIFVALMDAWMKLEDEHKATLLGDGVRIDLCCGAHKDFLSFRRSYWIARYKCALPKRP